MDFLANKSETSQFSHAQFRLFIGLFITILKENVAKLHPLRNQRTALLGTLILAYRKTLCPGNLNLRFISRFIGMIFFSFKIRLIYKDDLKDNLKDNTSGFRRQSLNQKSGLRIINIILKDTKPCQ